MKRKLLTRGRIALGLAAAGAATVLTAGPSSAATTHTCVRDGYAWIQVTSTYAAALPYYSPPQTFLCVMSSSDVYSDSALDLQIALHKCYGYGITPDGYFGPKTVAALKAFQQAHGLAADGVYGPLTAKAMTKRDTNRFPGNGDEGPCMTIPKSKIV